MKSAKDQVSYPNSRGKGIEKPPVRDAGRPTPNKSVKPLTKSQKYSGTL